MDTELIREDEHTETLYRGDIIIRNAATFREILDVLVLHATEYMKGGYTREMIIRHLTKG